MGAERVHRCGRALPRAYQHCTAVGVATGDAERRPRRRQRVGGFSPARSKSNPVGSDARRVPAGRRPNPDSAIGSSRACSIRADVHRADGISGAIPPGGDPEVVWQTGASACPARLIEDGAGGCSAAAAAVICRLIETSCDRPAIRGYVARADSI